MLLEKAELMLRFASCLFELITSVNIQEMHCRLLNLYLYVSEISLMNEHDFKQEGTVAFSICRLSAF